MSARTAWLAGFPLVQAEGAVEAIQTSWTFLASRPRKGFDYHVREPRLTKMLRQHAKDVTGPELGLTGFWGAEAIEDIVDFEEAEVLKEFRTDIHYNWMSDEQRLELIFEFKKLTRHDSSRKIYLGEEGLLRFITGDYSQGQPVAVMVGILMHPTEPIVDALRRTIKSPATAAALYLCKTPSGELLCDPSILFKDLAAFDTEHLRSKAKAPPHGTIRVAHLFLPFGHEPPVKKTSRKKLIEDLEDGASATSSDPPA